MKNTYLKLAIILAFVTLASGCAGNFRHNYLMRGQVMDVPTNDSLIVCVGTNDGAEVGQVLDVYRFIYQPTVSEEDDKSQYLSSHIGKVIIEEIVNDHYARAKILAGDILKNDTVQLNERS